LKKILIIGAGAWGTTMANLLAYNNEVIIWAFEKEVVDEINLEHRNTMYLNGIELNSKIKAVNDFSCAYDMEIIIIAVPSSFFDLTVQKLSEKKIKNKNILFLTKGFSKDGKFLSDILLKACPDNNIGVLSGPNLASEIIQGKPCSAVVASENQKLCLFVQKVISSQTFRIYTSDDIKGVQIGGAFKNIIAIGAGISDGLGYGTNTKSAYITRGLMEMTRFGVEMGAKPYTFMGLSGIGDLVATAYSPLSRNYSYGKEIALSDKKPLEIYNNSKKAIEGVEACKIVKKISSEKNIEIPITDTIFSVIFEGVDIKKAVTDLMTRELKEEIY